MWKDFKTFLIKQNAIALAIAVVIGAALGEVVKGIVDGLIMPIVAAVSPDPSSYQRMEWVIGSAHLKPGLIIAALINFIVVGFVVWRLARMFVKEPSSPEKASKSCPFCRMSDLDPAASRCPHCTSILAVDATAGAAPSLANTGAYLQPPHQR